MNYLDHDIDIEYVKVSKEEFEKFVTEERFTRTHYMDSTIYTDRVGNVVAIYRLEDQSYFTVCLE